MRVSLLGHEEYGTTLTRADGIFALAVPAGAWTLDIRASSFIPTQRWVTAQPGDYTPLEDSVVVLRRDEAMTKVSVAAGGFHRSTQRQDKDGERQVALFIPAGTGAELYFPDGGTVATDTVSLRVTEATVGNLGPEAMPATLPAASAYTFAADLSADEAVAAGADGVRFSRPVALYVDNFLRFAVGVQVPQGTYDSRAGKWEAQPDSLVVQVLAGGQLDSNGDGAADTRLPLLPGEAEVLAREFAPGTVVWRGVTTHFSTVDCNGAWRCIGTCDSPQTPDTPHDEPDCDEECGSLILAQNQTVSEFAPISGTDLALGWHSHRSGKRKHRVEVTAGKTSDGGTARDALGARFSLAVAGQRQVQEVPDAGYGFPASFVWDGKDTSGRTAQGPVFATISSGYSFKYVYVGRRGGSGASSVINNMPSSFAQWPPSADVEYGSGRDTVYFTSKRKVLVGDWLPRENLGGLSLNVLHGYSATTGLLFRGDGTQADVEATGAFLTHLAGGGTDSSEDAGFKEASLGGINTALAEGPDGTLYFVASGSRVRGLKPEGGVATVAGQTASGFAGDGQNALLAKFNDISALAADEAGRLFVVDKKNYRIRLVDLATGLVSTVVGNGQQGFSPDGTAALEAKLDGLDDVLVGRDGALYFGCYSATNNTGKLVRRLRDGKLETVAGGSAESGALEATSPLDIRIGNFQHWLAEGLDGSLYLAGYTSAHLVRRVAPDGRVTVLAGVGHGTAVEGLASDMCLSGVAGVAVDSAGTVYLAEEGGNAYCARGAGVRVVTTDGRFGTAAGRQDKTVSGEKPADGAAEATALSGIGELLLLRSGRVAFVHRGQRLTVHALSSLTGRLSLGERLVSSSDGAEVYAFGPNGRHLRTTEAVTGRRLWRFDWETAGLSSITDADGNVTRVTRDAQGRATSFIAQDGQVTRLTLDAEGKVVRLEDAKMRATGLGYGPSGLLASWTDANGNASTFEYDAEGKLVADTNARGARKTLSRTWQPFPYAATVTFTDADGRATAYSTDWNVWSERRLTALLPDGTKEVRYFEGPVRRRQSPDGTETTSTLMADSRFGVASTVPARTSVKTPSGLESVSTLKRAITTAPLDLLEVRSWRDEATVNGRTWVRQFDAANRSLTTSSPLGRAMSTLFDASWRPVEWRPPGVLPVSVTYDGRGRVTATTQGQRSSSFSYGSNGMLASVKDALGRVTELNTDSTGWLLSAKRPDAKAVGFAYDSVGNLTGLTPPEKPVHAFSYSKANELTQYAPPVLPDIGNEGMAYSLQGLLASRTYSDGSQATCARDSAGRATTLTTPWWTTKLAYHPATGQLASVERGGQRVEWKRDGFLVTEEKSSGVATGALAWAYDADFRVTSLAVNGATVSYAYDADGLLTNAGALVMGRSATTGQLSSATLGAVRTDYNCDAYGDVETIAATVGGAPLYREVLTRDALGRIQTKEETVQGVTAKWGYAYDAVGRIQQATKDGAPAGSWTYDANGNRLSDGTVAAAYDAQDRQLSYGGVAFGHDANGNRTTRTEGGSTTQFAHDGMAGLLSATLPNGTQLEYVLDGLQRRVAKKRNGVVERRWLYDGQTRVVAEMDAAGAVTRFVYGSFGHSPDYMVRGDASYRFVHDHLGSVRLVVGSATGAVAQRLEYDAWGNVTADTNPGFQPFGFAGGIHDTDTRLVHFGFRDYDPQVGRWTAKDPVGFGGGDLDLYAYALNSPANLVDTDGLQSEIALPLAPLFPVLLPNLPDLLPLLPVLPLILPFVPGNVMDRSGACGYGTSQPCYCPTKMDGERGKERKNPNPEKVKRHDHMSGKKLPPPKPPKDPIPLPDLVPRGGRKAP